MVPAPESPYRTRVSFGRDSHGIEGLSLDSVPLQPYRQESYPACNANPVRKQALTHSGCPWWLLPRNKGLSWTSCGCYGFQSRLQKKTRDLLEECQPAPKWVDCRVGPKAALWTGRATAKRLSLLPAENVLTCISPLTFSPYPNGIHARRVSWGKQHQLNIYFSVRNTSCDSGSHLTTQPWQSQHWGGDRERLQEQRVS